MGRLEHHTPQVFALPEVSWSNVSKRNGSAGALAGEKQITQVEAYVLSGCLVGVRRGLRIHTGCLLLRVARNTLCVQHRTGWFSILVGQKTGEISIRLKEYCNSSKLHAKALNVGRLLQLHVSEVQMLNAQKLDVSENRQSLFCSNDIRALHFPFSNSARKSVPREVNTRRRCIMCSIST